VSVRSSAVLAMAGGEPAVPPGSQVRWPQITERDREAVNRVLDRGILFGPTAPEVTRLQEEWSDYIGTRHCLLVNSGTAALHCALVGAGVGSGDEVIVPAFSFVATAMAVVQAGAVPVFADIDARLHTIDTRLVAERISDRTAAVIPVHVHGLPADMDELRTLCRRRQIALVEDACQAHGALYRGVRVGSLADGAGFSLNGSKHLPAGEGGLYVTNSDDAFVAARRLGIFGEDTPALTGAQTRAYNSHGAGWNYRCGELTAALARAQLERLDGRVETAQRNAAILTEAIADLPGFIPPSVPDDRTCVYYRYRVRLAPEEFGWTGSPIEFRDRVLHALREELIPAETWQLRALPSQHVFRRARLSPWQPGRDAEPLSPWDPDEYPETTRLLDSSIVIGSADHPIFCQPVAIAERYVDGLHKLVENIDVVLSADYEPLQPWPRA
jgi:dTDP-4-amino-4,6-dideoxygalactose transaminase